ncbi:MAG: hypothetical protein H6574_09455 [Lewinellaceae bacterium]|nr:hypothetical protein [Lewinellaceae bacterium]
MKKAILLLIASLCFAAPAITQNTRYYVHAAATGANTGQSWVDAFTDLQNALQLAQAGDEVWVAEGTYWPTTTTDRNISFEPKSGVKLYGGFSGTEISLDERDWEQYPAILSGDIGQPGDSTDNAYTVMYLHEPDSSTLLDGFTLRDGTADFSGLSTSRDRRKCGGGLYIMGEDAEAYPGIRNCRFLHNTARNSGGGAIVNGGGDGSVAPLFFNCHFEANRSLGNAGGLAYLGAAWVERGVEVDSCVFLRNSAVVRGGGFYYQDAERTDRLDIGRCQFLENQSESGGGGMQLVLGRTADATSNLFNNQFQKNYSWQGSAIAAIPLNFNYLKSLHIYNCSFWNNIGYNLSTNQGIIYGDYLPANNSLVLLGNNNFFQNYNSGYLIQLPGFEFGKLFIFENYFIENNIENSLISYYAQMNDLFTLVKCVFYNNKALALISGSYFNVELKETLFKKNHMRTHSIIPVYNTQVYTNCTIINNQICNNAAVPSPVKSMQFYNSIISGPGICDLTKFLTSDQTQITHSYFDTLDCAALPSNITCGPGILTGIDPLFVNPDSGDYRLQPCSPLINAGSNAYVLDSTDLDGLPRIRGGTVDIGAYEAQGPSLAAAPQTTPSCPGGASGAVEANVQAACLPLLFNWQSGANSGATLSGLPPGVYQFTVTDAKGLTATFSATVPEGDAPGLIPVGTALLCGDTTGGSASALLNPALPPLQFHWANGSTDSLRTGLPAGSYPLTLTDANGCSATGAVQVNKSGSLSVDIEAQAISCHAAADGAFTVLPANGKPPFLWNWASGATGPTIGPLDPGSYSGTLTDALGCTIQWVLPLTEPAPLQLQALVVNAGDSAVANGSIQLMSTGGTMPYDVLWSTGATGPLLDSLLPGMYTATLTDANGCSAVETYVVGVTSSVQEAGIGLNFSLSPNPAAEIVWLYLATPARTGLPLRVLNSAGQTVLAGWLPQGSTGLPLHIGALPRGVYAVQLGGRVEKLVKR